MFLEEMENGQGDERHELKLLEIPSKERQFENTMVTLSQELVSVGVMVIVCASLSVLCVAVWLVRCRRDQGREKEERDRQRDLDNYNDKQVNKSFSKRAVADKVIEPPKRAESVHSNRSIRSRDGSVKEPISLSNSTTTTDETIGQCDSRAAQAYVSRPLERIKEESTPIRNKRLETVSITASFETLQRNDSKVNVFPADKLEEIDLNPGLNTSVINLDTI
ncbi:unnamed protein product [Cylicocyclus nassatus]|uniref:Uncharacterized protein n=1 Tax=Cylicocyclus nassatus TaxID=53992 RepID=A0AA36M8B2_CYLNA|nr:unnamed protein product [Cylicocyclus nassatus]